MDNNQQGTQSFISKDMEIMGTVKSSGPIRIDGKLEGELHSTGDAEIGKSAAIKGNLVVNAIIIEGAIKGNIAARDRIEMKSSARVLGDIKAKRLSVEDGVTFVGKSVVNPSGTDNLPEGAAEQQQQQAKATPLQQNQQRTAKSATAVKPIAEPVTAAKE